MVTEKNRRKVVVISDKDSINIMLFLADPLTWPQVLYNYLESDPKVYEPIVAMMDKCSYPYTSLQNTEIVNYLGYHGTVNR